MFVCLFFNEVRLPGSAMSKLVTLKIVDGDFETGFRIVLRIAKNGELNSAEINGWLPPYSLLPKKYENWQLSYRNNRGIRDSVRALKAPKQQVTNFSIMESASELESSINDWLNSGESKFRTIRDKLVANLQGNDQGEDKIKLVIQTDNVALWRLPWHLWDLVEDNKFEVSISASEYEKAATIPITKKKKKVRILVILGDSSGIDTDKDLRLLQEELPSAYIHTLIHPTKEKLSGELWEQEWDLLFFAGHSSSEDENFRGKFQINESESLTINELKYALNNAIERGLKLAFFNSCDGLGLARELANLQIPATVVMREKVPDKVAQKFLEYFLKAFAKKEKSLTDAVREARERLREMEGKYACASWLPTICHNPAEFMPSWRSLLGESLDEGQISKAGRVKVGLQVPTSAITSLFDWIIAYKIRFVALCLVGGVSSAILRPVGAEFLSKKAAEAINSHQLESAYFYLDLALKLAPNNPKVSNNLGYIYYAFGNRGLAESFFLDAKNKLEPSGCNNYAYNKIEEGEYEEAEKLLWQCRGIAKDDLGLSYMLKNLGLALLKQEKYGEAEEHLRQAIALEPKLGPAHCLLAQVLEAKEKDALTAWGYCQRHTADDYREEVEWKQEAEKRLQIKEDKL
jgi:tetratricopeptide (TPR) repeat protein